MIRPERLGRFFPKYDSAEEVAYIPPEEELDLAVPEEEIDEQQEVKPVDE